MHSNEGKEDVQNFKYKIGMIYTNSTSQKYLAQNSSKKQLKKKHAHAFNFSKPTQKDIF